MGKSILMIAGVMFLSGVVGAMAQESRSEISLQGTGFFTKDSSGQGTSQRTTETGGFLIGYRYSLTRWLAAEAVYGYDRDTQRYFGSSALARVQANVHEVTSGFVVRVPKVFRLSPYVLAEGGALIFDPTGNRFGTIAGTSTDAAGVFAYGAGADFALVKHVILRAEYRGLVYNAPDFGLRTLNTNTVTHTAQPSAGIVFHF